MHNPDRCALPTRGRLTLPTELGAEETTRKLIERFGADAIRNSDGTDIPPELLGQQTRVYSKYFVNRGDNAWAMTHPGEVIELYLMSARHTAVNDQALTIRLLEGYFEQQYAVDIDHDPRRWWEVVDRTTDTVVPVDAWTWRKDGTVTITAPQPWHEYTAGFLAYNIWDPVQLYNHLTNDWGDKPHEIPYDLRHPHTRMHAMDTLKSWLVEHGETDVVRFTTFCYQFTLMFDDRAREKYVDWFGYSATVSPAALTEFEHAYGYRLRPEDFIDQGYYNSPFRTPSRAFRDWMDFVGDFVTGVARELVDTVHSQHKEAIMFLGDQWIGAEPYGPKFGRIGLDGVVGSVGSAATARLISDVPGVRYTEGRLLPYFFPDVFHPGGDPAAEARQSWISARRAILRKPLDRIGYGGYLSLAAQFPDFLQVTDRVVAEFREIHDLPEGEQPQTEGITVAVVNEWGALRSWQTHMVAHALWNRQTYSYHGVIEALAGLPLDVRFLSFADVLSGGLDQVDVVINAGALGTAYSGGKAWANPDLLGVIRAWTAGGGGLIGVGDPSGLVAGGRTFQLADVLGVDREIGYSLSTDKYCRRLSEHFITRDLPAEFDAGEGTPGVYSLGDATGVLRADGPDRVSLSVHQYGAGRAVYLAGLPYGPANTRLLHRSVIWAAGRDREVVHYLPDNPNLEVAVYPDHAIMAVANTGAVPHEGAIPTPSGAVTVGIPAGECRWFTLAGEPLTTRTDHS